MSLTKIKSISDNFYNRKITFRGKEYYYIILLLVVGFAVLASFNLFTIIVSLMSNSFFWASIDIIAFCINIGMSYFNFLMFRKKMLILKQKDNKIKY